MLPCRRGALLAKSAGFKEIPEDIQINHENYKKSIQKPSKKPFKIHTKNDAGNYSKNHRKYHQPYNFGVPFRRPALDPSGPTRVFLKTCFWNLRGRQNGAKRMPKEVKMEPKRVPK